MPEISGRKWCLKCWEQRPCVGGVSARPGLVAAAPAKRQRPPSIRRMLCMSIFWPRGLDAEHIIAALVEVLALSLTPKRRAFPLRWGAHVNHLLRRKGLSLGCCFDLKRHRSARACVRAHPPFWKPTQFDIQGLDIGWADHP